MDDSNEEEETEDNDYYLTKELADAKEQNGKAGKKFPEHVEFLTSEHIPRRCHSSLAPPIAMTLYPQF
ncbi:hypothetical protein V6N12_024217 [Hibiscus sabdariffa]|uniref:Uncharacterized protein n=1 Tax=Hibiscus sabdariffa TaxID=183260 RepID=A0ABR2FZX2_9ROSI